MPREKVQTIKPIGKLREPNSYSSPIIKGDSVIFSRASLIDFEARSLIRSRILPILENAKSYLSNQNIEIRLKFVQGISIEIFTEPYAQVLHFRYPKVRELGLFISALEKSLEIAKEYDLKAEKLKCNDYWSYTELNDKEVKPEN